MEYRLSCPFTVTGGFDCFGRSYCLRHSSSRRAKGQLERGLFVTTTVPLTRESSHQTKLLLQREEHILIWTIVAKYQRTCVRHTVIGRQGAWVSCSAAATDGSSTNTSIVRTLTAPEVDGPRLTPRTLRV